MKNIEYNGITLGPILKEEALLLQSVIKMTNPKVLVEFGYFFGASAKAMLEVMDQDATLHSFDNTKNPSLPDKRFVFHHQSQEEVEGIENIDFVFLDASHDLELNQKTFLKLESFLTPKAIIAVHDTGAWCDGNVFELGRGHQVDEGWAHAPDERRFVNWIGEKFPIKWQVIHLHSSRQVRHGITLLQKYNQLSV
jgi:predicted O-methyltransferase YrrM